MIKSIYNPRCSAAHHNELILVKEDELLGSDLTSHGPRRGFIKYVHRMQRGSAGLLFKVTVTVTFRLTVSQSVCQKLMTGS